MLNDTRKDKFHLEERVVITGSTGILHIALTHLNIQPTEAAPSQICVSQPSSCTRVYTLMLCVIPPFSSLPVISLVAVGTLGVVCAVPVPSCYWLVPKIAGLLIWCGIWSMKVLYFDLLPSNG